MTKKHFVAIAAAIRDLNAGLPVVDLDSVVTALADVCERFNDNFNRDKFVRACYPKED